MSGIRASCSHALIAVVQSQDYVLIIRKVKGQNFLSVVFHMPEGQPFGVFQKDLLSEGCHKKQSPRDNTSIVYLASSTRTLVCLHPYYASTQTRALFLSSFLYHSL